MGNCFERLLMRCHRGTVTGRHPNLSQSTDGRKCRRKGITTVAYRGSGVCVPYDVCQEHDTVDQHCTELATIQPEQLHHDGHHGGRLAEQSINDTDAVGGLGRRPLRFLRAAACGKPLRHQVGHVGNRVDAEQFAGRFQPLLNVTHQVGCNPIGHGQYEQQAGQPGQQCTPRSVSHYVPHTTKKPAQLKQHTLHERHC